MSNDQKNPLDVLEELLQKTKEKQGLGEDTAAEQAEREEAEKAAIEQQRLEEAQRQAALDAQGILDQRASLKTLQDTPQYQARMAQEAETQQNKQQTLTAQDGFQIEQLKHTKV